VPFPLSSVVVVTVTGGLGGDETVVVGVTGPWRSCTSASAIVVTPRGIRKLYEWLTLTTRFLYLICCYRRRSCALQEGFAMSFGHAAETAMHRVGAGLCNNVLNAWAAADRSRAIAVQQAIQNETAARNAVAAVDALTLAELRRELIYARAQVSSLLDEVDDLQDELDGLRSLS